jgi:apolipoprotein N-acyltransferase
MGDLAIVALVSVIGLFLVFFFLIAVGVAVMMVVGCEKRRPRWGMRTPWLPLPYLVFVPFAVLKEQHDKVCQTEKPKAQIVSFAVLKEQHDKACQTENLGAPVVSAD